MVVFTSSCDDLIMVKNKIFNIKIIFKICLKILKN